MRAVKTPTWFGTTAIAVHLVLIQYLLHHLVDILLCLLTTSKHLDSTFEAQHCLFQCLDSRFLGLQICHLCSQSPNRELKPFSIHIPLFLLSLQTRHTSSEFFQPIQEDSEWTRLLSRHWSQDSLIVAFGCQLD